MKQLGKTKTLSVQGNGKKFPEGKQRTWAIPGTLRTV